MRRRGNVGESGEVHRIARRHAASGLRSNPPRPRRHHIGKVVQGLRRKRPKTVERFLGTDSGRMSTSLNFFRLFNELDPALTPNAQCIRSFGICGGLWKSRGHLGTAAALPSDRHKVRKTWKHMTRFSDLALSPKILEAVEAAGYENPHPDPERRHSAGAGSTRRARHRADRNRQDSKFYASDDPHARIGPRTRPNAAFTGALPDTGTCRSGR